MRIDVIDVAAFILVTVLVILLVFSLSQPPRPSGVTIYLQEPDCVGKQLVYVLKVDADVPVWMCPQ